MNRFVTLVFIQPTLRITKKMIEENKKDRLQNLKKVLVHKHFPKKKKRTESEMVTSKNHLKSETNANKYFNKVEVNVKHSPKTLAQIHCNLVKKVRCLGLFLKEGAEPTMMAIWKPFHLTRGLLLCGLCITLVNSVLECQRNDTALEQVLSELESLGYEVERGWAYWRYNVSSYGANPMLGYSLFSFQREIGESDLSQEHSRRGEEEEEDLIISLKGAKSHLRPHQYDTDYYMLYASSAILWHDCTPPTEYISYRSYVNLRFRAGNSSSSNNDENKLVIDPYASLGDMLNQRVMNISTQPYGNRTFDNIATYVSTGDIETYTDIKNAFEKVLLSGETLDNFALMYRGGMVATTQGYTHDDWMDYMSRNYTIYKITPPASLRDNKKPRQACDAMIRNTTTGISEQTMYGGQLESAFQTLVSSVVNYVRTGFGFEYRTMIVSAPFYHGTLDYGFGCLEYDTRCLADNRDSQYFVTAPEVFYMTNSSYFLMIGVAHSLVGTNMWENIVPYFQEAGWNVGEQRYYRANHLCYMGDVYAKSAMNFPPNISSVITNPDILDKLFVVSFMRHVLCDSFDDGIPHFCITQQELAMDRKWFPFHRNYINPLTNTRPDWSEMIPFVLVEFDSHW
ncbi:hypothetical protein RFI_08313 [Reticulomyxa filosa]|uniref:Uncharacterized protein n=1 Tax=Reticulomyxa filosa TaxID=46433 RepID=X6NU63_RETFI|nr:hypothetical protein RFI_08313 [Reticulomyxa filosa]|eukprot:ETO28812.1 hypothetical protein RFI_08313 [Reticulomyxa filosa]